MMRASAATRFVFSLLIFIAQYDVNAQKPKLTIPSGHSAWITDYEVSSDGRYLATSSYDNTIKLYDYVARRELVTLFGHSDVVQSVAFSPDNKFLVSGSWDRTLKFWEIRTGKLLHTWKSPLRMNDELVYSPDGKTVVAVSDATMLHYDLRGDSILSLNKMDGLAGKALFYRGGSRIAVMDWMPSGDTSMIAVYDAASGEYLADESFQYKHGDILDFAISPSGNLMYTVVDTDSLNVRVHDMINNRDVARLHGHKIHPNFISAGETDSVFYSISLQNLMFNGHTEIKRWEWVNKQCTDSVVLRHDGRRGENFSYKFVKTHAELIAPLSSVDMQVLNGKSLHRKDVIRGHSKLFNAVAVLKRSLVLSSDDCTVKEINFATGDVQVPVKNPFLDNNFNIGDLFMVDDSSTFLYCSRASRYLHRWKKGVAPQILHVADSLINASDYDKSRHRFAYYSVSRTGNGKVTLLDSAGKIMASKSLPWANRNRKSLFGFTGDGRVMLKVSQVDSLIIWDHKSNTLSYVADEKRRTQHFDVTALDDDRVLVTNGSGKYNIVNIKSKKWLKEWQLDTSLIHQWTFNHDKSRLMVGLANGKIRTWNTKDWTLASTLQANQSSVTLVGFTQMPNIAYSSGMDNMLHLWDLNDSKILASVIVVDTTEWVVTKPDGLFDASPKAMGLIYYVVNDSSDHEEPWKVIQLDQLKHRYYQPNLLPIQLGFSKEPLREVPALETVELAPKVRASLSNTSVKVQLSDQGGGIGSVTIYVNGAEIVADARPSALRGIKKREVEFVFDLKPFEKRFGQEVSVIKIIAWNQKGWIRSNPVILNIGQSQLSKKGVDTEINDERKNIKPHLYALIVGTSEYAGNGIDLRYSAKDAKDFEHALQLTAERLFKKEHTHIELLTTDEKDLQKLPTKKNIVKSLNAVATKISPEDIFIVYFSGHGVSVSGETGDFYYVTAQATANDLTKMNDPAINSSVGLSSTELTQAFNKISAKKKILILDACNSGKAAEQMITAVKDVPASQIRALDRMNDRTGFYVLSGSAADAVSYESSVYGQGLLTYALLKAMKGASLRSDGTEEYVDVHKLFFYAVEQVPALAAGIGGIQKPLYRSPGDQRSFDIGKVDELVKQQIIISEPKPVFVASTFQDSEQLYDELNLSEEVNGLLREMSAKGKNADLIFTDAKTYPGAYRLSGNYKRSGDQLILNYVVTKDKKPIAQAKEIVLKSFNSKDVATSLFDAVRETLESAGAR